MPQRRHRKVENSCITGKLAEYVCDLHCKYELHAKNDLPHLSNVHPYPNDVVTVPSWWMPRGPQRSFG